MGIVISARCSSGSLILVQNHDYLFEMLVHQRNNENGKKSRNDISDKAHSYAESFEKGGEKR